VYIAGRIDDTDKGLFEFYERITKLVESLGFKVWLPHRDTRNLIKKKYKTFEERALALYHEAENTIKNRTNLMIAYVGRPSLGTGEELQMGKEVGIDIVGVAEEDAIITPTVLENPAVKLLIRFKDLGDLEEKLREHLLKYKDDPDYFKKIYDPHEKFLVWNSPEAKEQYNQYKWMWEDLV
jgi:hypothetical protein